MGVCNTPFPMSTGGRYEQLTEVLRSSDPQVVIDTLLSKIVDVNALDAAWMLFENLVAERAKEAQRPPVIKSLDVLLNEPILSNAFKKYLREGFSSENWDFWLDVQNYRLSYPTLTEVDRVSEAYRIYDAYIRAGADLQVNISAASRRLIEAHFTTLETDPEDLAIPFTSMGTLPTIHTSTSTKPYRNSLGRLTEACSWNTRSVLERKDNMRRISEIVRSAGDCVKVTPRIFWGAEREIRSILELHDLPEFCLGPLYSSCYRLLQTQKSIDEDKHYQSIHDFEISTEEWRLLLHKGVDMTFAQGDVVLEQQKYAPFLYCVMEGEMEASFVGATEQLSFHYSLHKGDLFGEIGVFCGSFRSFSTVKVVSETAVVKRVSLSLVFQYFLFEPVIALRFYVTTGKLLTRLLTAVDMATAENTNLSTVLEEQEYTYCTHLNLEDPLWQDEEEGLSSLLFQKLFPNHRHEYVYCESNAVLLSPFLSKKVILYITGETLNFVVSETKRRKTIPMVTLSLLRTCGRTLYLSVKRKKLSFRFVNEEIVQRVYALLSALLSTQKEKQLETEIKELCQSQPSLSQRDWKVFELLSP